MRPYAQAPEGTYTSGDICRLAGITYRQLDGWCRIGILHPRWIGVEGTGGTRYFPASELVRVQALAEMIDLGLSFQRARDLLARGKRAVVVVQDLPAGPRLPAEPPGPPSPPEGMVAVRPRPKPAPYRPPVAPARAVVKPKPASAPPRAALPRVAASATPAKRKVAASKPRPSALSRPRAVSRAGYAKGTTLEELLAEW